MWKWLIDLLFKRATSPTIEQTEKLMSDSTRHINQAGLDLIKSSEGLRLEAYPDPGTGASPITIGYGTTGPDIKLGMTISKEQAEEFLKRDCEKFEKQVSEMVTVPISDNAFAALVCFTYNVGAGSLKSSTLLKLLNSGAHPEEVGSQFLRWNKANGKTLPGLTIRRQAEKDLFLTP
jgi:lysozyme